VSITKPAIKHVGKAVAQDAVIAIATEDVFNLLQVVIAKRAG
jgi:hypothetical protein